MTAKLRPELDAIASFRVGQIMRLQNRNASNATNHLVDLGWRATMAEQEARAMPGLATSKSKTTVACYLHDDVISAVKDLATRERRSFSAQVDFMLQQQATAPVSVDAA